MKKGYIQNFQYILGNSAEENWEILDLSQEYHILFHLQSFPSCYLILNCDNPNLEIIKKCAEICLENTKYKNLKNVYVDYTKIKNVKKGDKIGELIYTSNRQVKNIRL